MSAYETDPRIQRYISIINALRNGETIANDLIACEPDDEIAELGVALYRLANAINQRRQEEQHLQRITTSISAGLTLNEVLDSVYEDFAAIIPYDRIGFSLIEDDGKTVRSVWARTNQTQAVITEGYSAPLAGSSLQQIIATGKPRIINDLQAYLQSKPQSSATRDILSEGMRSSLTCPLIAYGKPVGFLFFSSTKPNTYADIHRDVFKRIADQVSIMVEKSRLMDELAEQRANLEAKNTELLRLNEIKNTFVGIATHDLRNPVSTLQMQAQVLANPNAMLTEDEHNTILNDMEQQTKHMLALLDDLLDITVLDSGNITLELEHIPLKSFLQTTAERHERLAAPKHSRVCLLTHSLTDDDTIFADARYLRQIMDNLLSNAVKFSPPNSIATVDVQHTADGWIIGVQDQGPGLAPEDHAQLFENFARLSARPTGGEKSTGLGLAITRRLVAAHGGSIHAESEPDQGARFWFILPHEDKTERTRPSP